MRASDPQNADGGPAEKAHRGADQAPPLDAARGVCATLRSPVARCCGTTAANSGTASADLAPDEQHRHRDGQSQKCKNLLVKNFYKLYFAFFL